MNQYIDKLNNMKIINIGRFIDMLCTGFGNDIMEYALHIQSPWRITDKESRAIIAAQLEVFTGLTEDKKLTVFDVNLNKLNEKIRKRKVTLCSINDYGDLKIDLENKYVLEVFGDSSEVKEYWRLLECQSDEKQFVVYGQLGGIIE